MYFEHKKEEDFSLTKDGIWINKKLSDGYLIIKALNVNTSKDALKKVHIFKVNKEVGFIAHIKNHIFILGLQGELRIQNLKSKKF